MGEPTLVMGEVTTHGFPRPLACDVPLVVKAQQQTRKGGGFILYERLYECDNGLALAARRGGPLHMADANTWEVAVLSPQRFLTGPPVGWVDEEKLLVMVTRLAAWQPGPVQS